MLPQLLGAVIPVSTGSGNARSADRDLKQCKHWFLIDLVPDLSAGTLCRLPDIEVIRNLSHENPSKGISLIGDDSDGNTTSASSADSP